MAHLDTVHIVDVNKVDIDGESQSIECHDVRPFGLLDIGPTDGRVVHRELLKMTVSDPQFLETQFVPKGYPIDCGRQRSAAEIELSTPILCKPKECKFRVKVELENKHSLSQLAPFSVHVTAQRTNHHCCSAPTERASAVPH